jgi:hypothetical protein
MITLEYLESIINPHPLSQELMQLHPPPLQSFDQKRNSHQISKSHPFKGMIGACDIQRTSLRHQSSASAL